MIKEWHSLWVLHLWVTSLHVTQKVQFSIGCIKRKCAFYVIFASFSPYYTMDWIHTIEIHN